MNRRTERINVSQKDIANGYVGDPQYCPIARAVRRKFKVTKEKGVSVQRDCMRVNGVVYELPESAKNFILNYDDLDSPVEEDRPFSFRVRRRYEER